MRWFTFFILAYLFVSVQFALGGILRLGEFTPNIVLLLVIFIGLHAPLDAALLAGFMLGFMHDVVSIHGIGTYALAYSLIAALAYQLRGLMYADHAATHFTMTAMLGLLLIAYLLLRYWLRGFFFAEEVSISFWPQTTGMLLASVLAVPTIYLLRKMRRAFHFNNK